jgi:hypothetical protein
MSNDKYDNQPNESVQLNPAIKMSIEQAHAIWGIQARERHDKQQQHLAFTSQEVHSRPAGEKAVKYNKRVYHDIATAKESENDKSFGRKMVWHITAEETDNFKRSKFFMAKIDMPKEMCTFMQQEKLC